MTADAFDRWLDAMGITAAEAARRLGVTPNTITRYRKHGAPLAIAIACTAIYHRMEPWK